MKIDNTTPKTLDVSIDDDFAGEIHGNNGFPNELTLIDDDGVQMVYAPIASHLIKGTILHKAIDAILADSRKSNHKQYIYHTDRIKVSAGYCDTQETIEDWINSNPYPGYELYQLNYTTSGHQSVWKCKEEQE